MTDPHHVRWMVARDLPAVVAISDASFAAASFAALWGEADFRTVLRRRNCIGMVVERGGTDVLAFAIYELHPREVKLLNFAVAPAHRRQGIGTAMLDKLKYKSISHRRDALTALVHDANLAAQLFFHGGGLRAVAVDREARPGEVAYAFEYRPTAADRASYGFAGHDLSPLS